MPARFTDEGRIIRDPDIDPDDYLYPIHHPQVRQLLGKMLTHIDALGLPEAQQKAAKDLVRQSISEWWASAQDNSLTSYKGCIGPIETQRAANGTEKSYVWVALTEDDKPTRVEVG